MRGAVIHNSLFMLRGFTLLELLITLGIISILTGTLLTILNPVELLRKARDTKRIQDLDSINTALLLYQTELPTGSFGATTSVSVSVPDTSGTCANLGLPTLPTGFTYRCVTSANLQKTDGNGWIPVNFGALSSTIGSNPLPYLPIDPTNTTSTGSYYTYIPGGSWELTAGMEASSNKSPTSESGKDGGSHHYTYEKGTSLTLTPTSLLARSEDSSLKSGLVGWWTFDEGSGTTAYDSSGGTSNAPFYYGGGGGSMSYSASSNCKTGSCLSYSAASGGYSARASTTVANFGTGNFTLSAWVQVSQPQTYGRGLFGNYPHAGNNGDLVVGIEDSRTYLFISERNLAGVNEWGGSYDFTPYWNRWTHIAWVKNGSNVSLYIDGTLKVSTTVTTVWNVSLNGNAYYIGSTDWCPGTMTSKIDDHRIYNRALSASEVSALYNATR